MNGRVTKNRGKMGYFYTVVFNFILKIMKKFKIFLYIIAAVMMITVATVVISCVKSDVEVVPKVDIADITGNPTETDDENTDGGFWRVGVPNIDLPPMIIWEKNKLTGFEAELIAETAKRLGFTYEIVPIFPGTERELLEDEMIDVAWGNMMDTGKQRLFYDMTEPYITIPQVIVIYERSGITEKKDIKNVSAVLSTPAESLLKDRKIGIEVEKINSSKNYSEAFALLRDGAVDAVICDKTLAEYMRDLDDQIVILDENVAEVKYSAAFSYDHEDMRIAADQVLGDIIYDGVTLDLSKKWLGSIRLTRNDGDK